MDRNFTLAVDLLHHSSRIGPKKCLITAVFFFILKKKTQNTYKNGSSVILEICADRILNPDPITKYVYGFRKSCH